MRVEIINSEYLTVFLNKCYFDEIDFEKKSDIIVCIKDIISKIDSRYRLNLNGFYKIKVFPNKKLGVYLDLIKIDDNDFNDRADFRIVIYQDSNFYLEMDVCDIKNIDEKIYYNNNFYININDINNIDKYMDYGQIIYGDRAKEIEYYGKKLK